MGSYCEYYVNAQNVTGELEKEILAAANELEYKSDDDGLTFETHCWRRWSESSKWGAEDLVSFLSKKFPKVIFLVKMRGDYTGNTYYIDGDSLDETEIWRTIRYPTPKEFKTALADKDTRRKQAHEKYAADQKAKELATAQARLVAIESEKKLLQVKLSGKV